MIKSPQATTYWSCLRLNPTERHLRPLAPAPHKKEVASTRAPLKFPGSGSLGEMFLFTPSICHRGRGARVSPRQIRGEGRRSAAAFLRLFSTPPCLPFKFRIFPVLVKASLGPASITHLIRCLWVKRRSHEVVEILLVDMYACHQRTAPVSESLLFNGPPPRPSSEFPSLYWSGPRLSSPSLVLVGDRAGRGPPFSRRLAD